MVRKIWMVLLVLIPNFVCARDTLITNVLVDQSDPAFTVYIGVTPELEPKVRPYLRENGVSLVQWVKFRSGVDKFVNARISRNDYPAGGSVQGIVDLIQKYPGSQFGLTWNGGIAITFNDYQYAKKTFQDQSRPASPATDPVNPAAHLPELLR